MEDNVAPLRVAVILPCHNEVAAIGDVVASFKKALPDASIYVYDNASSDDTASIAEQAGAVVRYEAVLGKGNAVRRAFADVDADIYLIADGDGTYDASLGPQMTTALVRDNLDMVVGIRRPASIEAFRAGHMFGNRLFNLLFRLLFKATYTDIFSGYRAFSRRYVKSFPSTSKGFEIELEMCTHAALLRLPVMEIETTYKPRPHGGDSKLKTFVDGLLILRSMMRFLRLHRPRFVYSLLAAFVGGTGIIGAMFHIGPLANPSGEDEKALIFFLGLILGGLGLFSLGAILNAQARYFAETKRLAYLRMRPSGQGPHERKPPEKT